MRKKIIENIKTLGKTVLPHLWKDEIGDVFVLTRTMEIYPYSKTVLGCFYWNKKHTSIEKNGADFR